MPSDPTLPVVLFLDFDGVLHHMFPVEGVPDEDNQHFRFLAQFEAALRARPRPVEIVVTSSWRQKYSLDRLRQFFSPDIAALIVGTTPAIGTGRGPGARRREVEAWMAAHRSPQAPWLAVDDFPVLYGPGAPVVVCPDRFGPEQAASLIQALADPAAHALAHPVEADSGELQIVSLGPG